MSQWTEKNEKAGAPIYVTNATTGESGTDEFGTAVFGYDTDAVEGTGLSSPGWVRIIRGRGLITALEIVDGGVMYKDTDVVTIDEEEYAITVDANGAITEIVDYEVPEEEVDQFPEITITTDTGVNAKFSFVSSGKIGRSSYETLVAMRNIED